jgi:hypothetical protein
LSEGRVIADLFWLQTCLAALFLIPLIIAKVKPVLGCCGLREYDRMEGVSV